MKVIVLNAGKCSWGKCLFCGWGKEYVSVSANELIDDFDKKRGKDGVKIFCSGSLLDDQQFPVEFQKHVARVMKDKELYIESRPEYVTPEKLELFKGVNLTIAMGLEAADNELLKKLSKGITLKQFSEACKLIHDHGFRVKAYVLVNPPYDKKGLLDKTVKFAKEHCDETVLINTHPHSKSGLFNLWVKGKWTPLSEEEFLKKTSKYENVQLEPSNYAFIPMFLEKNRDNLKGVGVGYIDHPHFNVWQDYLSRIYKKPDKDIALFLPCSKKKPYYNSRTHRSIRRMITGFDWYKKIHIIVISNPGVIPIEFADRYPFNAYDWDERLETPKVMKEYVKLNTERLKNYLRNHEYKKVFSYFKPKSESGLALEKACKELGVKLVKLVDKKVYARFKDKRNPLIHPLMLRSFKEKIAKELT